MPASWSLSRVVAVAGVPLAIAAFVVVAGPGPATLSPEQPATAGAEGREAPVATPSPVPLPPPASVPLPAPDRVETAGPAESHGATQSPDEAAAVEQGGAVEQGEAAAVEQGGAVEQGAAEAVEQGDGAVEAGQAHAELGPGPYAVTMVRAAGTLDPGLLGALAAAPGVAATSPVRAGQLRLVGVSGCDGAPAEVHPDGWVVPLDVAGIDPVTYPPLLPAATREPFATLAAGEALLSQTSAAVRGLDVGAVLHLPTHDLRVIGVVADALVGTAEAVVDAATAERLGLRVQFFVVGTPPGDTAAADGVAAPVAPAPRTIADHYGHAQWPASWREVLPLAVVKERFGEFAYRPLSGRGIAQDPAWVETHLATASVPLLGEVRCHRAILGPLAAALAELEGRGLGHLVDPRDYAGCHSPRLMAAGGPVSRHAWGLAVDLNASANPFGAPPTQDPRLVEVMDRHGFGYGGRWPTPDGMHFEYRGG